MSRQFGLSKSKIAAFDQCAKRLWLQVHRPDLAAVDDGASLRFASGHEVGAIACSLIHDGTMVEAEPDLTSALLMTQQLLASEGAGSIFEATFAHDGILIRVDILSPDGGGGWTIAEVKSTTSAKDHHLDDLATQVWVAQQAGVTISGAAIRHIDGSFVLAEPGRYDGLFADTDMLEAVAPTLALRGETVRRARATLAGGEPKLAPGDHCNSPYDCEFAAYCRRDLPAGPIWPVDLLPNGGGKKWRRAGVDDLMMIDSADLGGREGNVIRATQSGQPYHDAEAARQAIAGWTYPRAWIDFETIAFAAPRWVGTRPYQQVPFQFSLHIEAADGTTRHRGFLDTSGDDPRRACARALIGHVPPDATLVAYNASFEKRVLLDLAEAMPDHAPGLRDMASRLVDLLPVTRQTWYHRDQRGSWSIKAVLPTLTPLDYSGFEVRDGSKAQQAWLEAIAPHTTPERKAAIRMALEAYCEQDTWAMVSIARALTAESGNRCAGGPRRDRPRLGEQ